MKNFAIIGTVALMLMSQAALAVPPIEQIAPENSVFVAGMRNTRATVARVKETPLYELWNTEHVKELRLEGIEKLTDGFNELLAELDLDEEHVVYPSGTVGLALYAVLDPELGTMKPAYLAVADYGEEIDKAWEVIEAALERGEADDEIEYEERNILNRSVYLVTLPEMRHDDVDPDEFGMVPFPMMPDVSDLTGHFREVCIVREGNGIMICSAIGSVTEALERIDSETLGVLTRRGDYNSLTEMLGSNDVYALVLTRDLMSLVSGMDTSGMAMMLGPMVKSLFGDIKGMGLTMQFNADEAMIVQRSAVYMPAGKTGLPSLLDLTRPREPLPPFVSPDTMTFASVNVAMDRLPDVLGTIVRSNPMLQMQLGEQYPEIDAMLRELVATLGSRMYFVGTLRRPIAADSMGNTLAVECRDTQAFENFIAENAADAGLEPRDFLGQRIYTSRDSGMLMMMMGLPAEEFSLGLGGGYIFLGPTTSVEQALRATGGAADRPATLADEGIFRRAMATLPPDEVTIWGYSNIIDSMEAQATMSKLMQERMLEEMRRDFPDIAEEMERQADDEPDPLEHLDFDLVRRYIGPSVSMMRSTDRGFVGMTYYLSAE